MSPYTKESIMGRWFLKGNLKLFYVKLSGLGITAVKTSAIIGAAIAGNFRSALTTNNHVDHYKIKVNVNAVGPIKHEEALLTAINSLELTRISKDHHQNISLGEMQEMCRASRYIDDGHNFRVTLVYMMYNRARELDIDNRASMVTFFMYIMVAPIFAVVHLANILAEANDSKQFETILKDESGAAKQQQTIWRNDLSAVYELNTLRNRVYQEVDWNEEIKNRTEISTVPISTTDVYTLATQIFRDGKQEGKRPHDYEWTDYWKQRWSRFPGGSIVSQYDEDISRKKALMDDAKIKSAWFSSISQSSHEQWLGRPCSIFATTSTKYEWGKVRALYGCDVTSFLHSDFSMPNCEDTLPSYFPVGKAASQTNVEKAMSSFDETIPVCFDYDDFNSQHSKSAMKAVLAAWKDVFSNHLTDKQISSLDWTIRSIDCMKVRFNEVNRTIEIAGTLLSGWRLTTFINTVLNRVYLMKAGLANLAIYALHNGDDVFAGCSNVGQASAMIRAAMHNGIRAQVTKTNIGTIGEFLRVDTRAKSPTSKQYLSRSISTAVHGRVEASAPNDLFALIKANDTRMDEVKQRGGICKVVDVAARRLDKFVAHLFNVNIEVIDMYRKLHPIQGGCNEKAEMHNIRLVRDTEPMSDEMIKNYIMIKPGVYDYVDVILSKFRLPPDIVSRKSVLNSAIQSLVRDKVSYKIVVDDRWNALNYRMIYKAWAKSGYVTDIAKIRSLGFVVSKQLRGVSNAAASVVRNSYDPLAVMQYAF